MKKQGILATAGAIVLVAGTAFAMGQGGGRDHGRRHGGLLGPLGKALRRLDLTDAQRTEIRSLVESRKEEAKPLRDALRDGRKEMREDRKDGDFDESEFRADFRRQAKVREDLAVLRAKTVRDVLAKLTPAQKERLAEMRGRMQERRRERREHGGRRHRFGGAVDGSDGSGMSGDRFAMNDDDLGFDRDELVPPGDGPDGEIPGDETELD